MNANGFEIPYVDLGAEHAELEDELIEATRSVLRGGRFILGDWVERFEDDFARYCGTAHAIGVANGTDALSLVLRALGLGPGDEVITATNSFVASASAIALVGARPVLVDVGSDMNLLPSAVEAAVTPRTRAIVPVHLNGRPAAMREVRGVAERHGLAIVEDCAQAAGARIGKRTVGSFGVAGCFSLHPLKNLGACGDGGIVVTNDAALRDRLRLARNHGLRTRDECTFFSPNSRLDALQAALLSVKLRYLEQRIARRRHHASRYVDRLGDVLEVSREVKGERWVYQAFVVQSARREKLRAFLASHGVEAVVHYPTPIHLQPAAGYLGYTRGSFPEAERQANRILSLPVSAALRDEQRERVCDLVMSFQGEEGEA